VNLEEKNVLVELTAPLDEALITKTISDAGFSVTGITASKHGIHPDKTIGVDSN